MLSYQAATGLEEAGLSPFFGFVSWTNFLLSFFYLGSCLFYFAGLFFFPGALVKLAERSGKSAYVFLALHLAFFFLLGFGYSEISPIGSPGFFEHFRIAGLFWIFIGTSVLFLGKLLKESFVPALAVLELEVASGKLERSEEILGRLKGAFIFRRLSSWLDRLSRTVTAKAHEIAQLTHDAVALVSREKPTEIDLRLVEDRYRRADNVYKKLEKENQRFLLSLSLFETTESENEKINERKDQFSRELRNAKIELAGVRKRIDERLVALKNSQTALRPPVEKIPTEKVPAEKTPAEPVASK
jgi:hypothetical protein